MGTWTVMVTLSSLVVSGGCTTVTQGEPGQSLLKLFRAAST